LGAEKNVYWESYIFLDDEIGRPFFDLLEKKSKEGVEVKLVIDSWGSYGLSKSRLNSLKVVGVELLFFSERKKRYHGWWKKLKSRTHRKVLVVDENIGFLGGVNVGLEMQNWLDIQVSFTGKVVHSLLRYFAKNYIIAGGKKRNVKHLLQYKYRLLHSRLHLVFDEPDSKNLTARKKYSEALLKARERVIIFS
jgi:cardiolipin synthase